MPSQTFNNLKEEKKTRIRAALLTEFSQHSLADAQVARIVRQAGIARGAFYKYFKDLDDAYQYLYHCALIAIHSAPTRQHQLLTAGEYVTQVRNFISQVHRSPYYDMIKLHYQTNASLCRQMHQQLRPIGAAEWGVMVLVHETIKTCLLRPNISKKAIDRLQKLLTAILEGED